MAENRSETGARNPNGTFRKGSSGNPKGRPKKPAAVKKYAKEAVKELYSIASCEKTPVKLRADIWRWFFEVEYGKPTQQIDSDSSAPAVISVAIDDGVKEFAG